ncbi:MAG: serine/threonine-protein phosphatase [Oscillospiraceae bacterium]|nr:serine/threonine-protein phosphatase [Oscillospiraceae bacterium]
MDYIAAASTDIGISKSTNQDSFGVKVLDTEIGRVVFAVLCDGMGGLSKGEVASATVVDAFNKWALGRLPVLCASGLSDNSVSMEWNNIIVECNEKIKLYGKRCGVSLGTTVTALLLTPTRYFIANVGDTRAYEIYSSVSTLTNDQTVVAREVSLGNITQEQAKTDPRRSVLLQCVGASDSVYPDFFFGDIKTNAVYMLCSDGFRHEISEQEIYSFLNPNVMCEREQMTRNMNSLIEMNKQRQERDNITVVTIRTF